MDGRALRYVPALVALARERHFGRAATALKLSQSVVSRQIAELEATLGFALVRRTTRQVELTPAGQRLVEGLLDGLGTIDGALAEAREFARGRKGLVRIGYTRVAILLVGGKAVQALRQDFPDLTIELHEMGINAQAEALRRQAIDIGLLHPPVSDEVLDVRMIWEEELGIALPLDHRLARQEQMELSQVATEPVILFPRHVGPVLFDALAAQYRDAGGELTVAQECTSWETAVDIVATGLGIAWAPRIIARGGEKVAYVGVAEAPTLKLAVATRRAARHQHVRVLADRIGAPGRTL